MTLRYSNYSPTIWREKREISTNPLQSSAPCLTNFHLSPRNFVFVANSYKAMTLCHPLPE